jgi:transketolase
MDYRELDELCVNTLRFLSVDPGQNAKSGHLGRDVMATGPSIDYPSALR